MDVMVPSPLQKIRDNIYIKREDIIHPFVSGNKFRKLKYNLLHLREQGILNILSFGGAYSNHIHALAYSCKVQGLNLKLMVRGEEVNNPTISEVRKFGAEIEFIDRRTYRKRNDSDFLKTLSEHHPNSYIIPEGGSNPLAIKGMSEMMDEVYEQLPFDKIQIIVAYGSGGTSLGIMDSMRPQDDLHIIPVLKFPDFNTELESAAARINVSPVDYEGHVNYNFGGYAKFTPELIQFIWDFYQKYEIPLDPIYTGKVFFAAEDLIKKGKIKLDIPVVIIHTGGLQGVKGFNQRFNMNLPYE